MLSQGIFPPLDDVIKDHEMGDWDDLMEFNHKGVYDHRETGDEN